MVSLKSKVFNICTKLYNKRTVVDAATVCLILNITIYSRKLLVSSYVSNWKTTHNFNKKFKVGDFVEANWKGKGTFYPAHVSAIKNSNGRKLFSVIYTDDGEEEDGLWKKNVRQTGLKIEEEEEDDDDDEEEDEEEEDDEEEKEEEEDEERKEDDRGLKEKDLNKFLHQINKNMVKYLGDLKDDMLNKQDIVKSVEPLLKLQSSKYMKLEAKIGQLEKLHKMKLDDFQKELEAKFTNVLDERMRKFEKNVSKIVDAKFEDIKASSVHDMRKLEAKFEDIKASSVHDISKLEAKVDSTLKKIESSSGKKMLNIDEQLLLNEFNNVNLRLSIVQAEAAKNKDIVNLMAKVEQSCSLVSELGTQISKVEQSCSLEAKVEQLGAQISEQSCSLVAKVEQLGMQISEQSCSLVAKVEQSCSLVYELDNRVQNKVQTQISDLQEAIKQHDSDSAGAFTKLTNLLDSQKDVKDSEKNAIVKDSEKNAIVAAVNAFIQVAADKFTSHMQSVVVSPQIKEFSTISTFLVRFKTYLESFASSVDKSFVKTESILTSIESKILERLPEPKKSQIQIMSDQDILISIYNMVQEMNNTKIVKAAPKSKKRKHGEDEKDSFTPCITLSYL